MADITLRLIWYKLGESSSKMAEAAATWYSKLRWEDHVLDILLIGWLCWCSAVVIVINSFVSFVGPLQRRLPLETLRAKESGGKPITTKGAGVETCQWFNTAINWCYLHYYHSAEFLDEWIKSLNVQINKLGGPVQTKFERIQSGSLPPKFTDVSCEATPEDKFVIHVRVDSRDLAFVIFCSQQTHEGVKLTNCTATVFRLRGTLLVKAFKEAGEIKVTVGFDGRPDIKVNVKPANPYQDPADMVDIGIVEESVRQAICMTTTTFVITHLLTPDDRAHLKGHSGHDRGTGQGQGPNLSQGYGQMPQMSEGNYERRMPQTHGSAPMQSMHVQSTQLQATPKRKPAPQPPSPQTQRLPQNEALFVPIEASQYQSAVSQNVPKPVSKPFMECKTVESKTITAPHNAIFVSKSVVDQSTAADTYKTVSKPFVEAKTVTTTSKPVLDTRPVVESKIFAKTNQPFSESKTVTEHYKPIPQSQSPLSKSVVDGKSVTDSWQVSDNKQMPVVELKQGLNNKSAADSKPVLCPRPVAETKHVLGTKHVTESKHIISSLPDAVSEQVLVTKPIAESQQSLVTKPVAEFKQSLGTKPVAESKQSIGTKTVAEPRQSMGTKPIAESKQIWDTKPITETKHFIGTKAAVEPKPIMTTRLIVESKTILQSKPAVIGDTSAKVEMSETMQKSVAPPRCYGQFQSQVSSAADVPPKPPRFAGEKRLLVKVIKANGIGAKEIGPVDPVVLMLMDDPIQNHSTSVIRNTANPFWDESFLFDVTQNSNELRFEVYDKSKQPGEDFIGETTVYTDDLRRTPSSRQILALQSRPGHVDSISGSLTVEFLYMDSAEAEMMMGMSGMSNNQLSPKRRIETERTVTPGGTVITTTTTTTHKPQFGHSHTGVDGSPSFVEKRHRSNPDLDSSDTLSAERSSPYFGMSGDQSLSESASSELLVINGVESVTEAAIRELKDSTRRPRTPTKTSTLIITGVKRTIESSPTEEAAISAAAAAEADKGPIEKEKKKSSFGDALRKRFGRKKRSQSADRAATSLKEGANYLRPPEQTYGPQSKDDMELVRSQEPPKSPNLKKSRSLGGSLKKLFRRGRKRSKSRGESSRDSSFSRSSGRQAASQNPSRDSSLNRHSSHQRSASTS